VEVAFATVGDSVTGVDLEVIPAGAPVRWELFLDDTPWPEEHVYGGEFGLSAPVLRSGILGEEGRLAALGGEPFIDPLRDLGLFVTRASTREPEAIVRGKGGAGDEMKRLMREWGYAHGPTQGASGSE
jgi:hypothetical protein